MQQKSWFSLSLLSLSSIYQKSSVSVCRHRYYHQRGDNTTWVKEGETEGKGIKIWREVEETSSKRNREINLGEITPALFTFLFLSLQLPCLQREEKRRDEKRREVSIRQMEIIIFKDNNYIYIIKNQFQPPVILFPTKSSQFWLSPVNNYISSPDVALWHISYQWITTVLSVFSSNVPEKLK